jgi:hypothetical protein
MAPHSPIGALPQPSVVRRTISSWLPARRDGSALGFGLAFILFGLLGVLRAAGYPVPNGSLYPTILIGLGAAGLLSLLAGGRR